MKARGLGMPLGTAGDDPLRAGRPKALPPFFLYNGPMKYALYAILAFVALLIVNAYLSSL